MTFKLRLSKILFVEFSTFLFLTSVKITESDQIVDITITEIVCCVLSSCQSRNGVNIDLLKIT